MGHLLSASPAATAASLAAAALAAPALATAATRRAVLAPAPGRGLLAVGLAVALERVGGSVALRHHLALVDPVLHADSPEGRLGLVEAVVDVRAQSVERDAALGIALGTRHLGATQPAGHLHPDAGRAGANRGGQRALHRAAERNSVLKLLGDRLRNELRVELGALHLEDVHAHLLARHAVQVAAQRVDLGARLPDHDPGARGVDVDRHLVLVLADPDVGQAGVAELALDVLADLDVL